MILPIATLAAEYRNLHGYPPEQAIEAAQTAYAVEREPDNARAEAVLATLAWAIETTLMSGRRNTIASRHSIRRKPEGERAFE